MNKREAMRRVCHGAAVLLDNGSENLWLTREEGGSDAQLSAADRRRMQEAFDALCMELRKRGGESG